METEEEKQEGPAYIRGTLRKVEPVVPEEDSNSDDDEKAVDRSEGVAEEELETLKEVHAQYVQTLWRW